MRRFQPPPRRTQRADFPHYALLFASRQGLWDLSRWRDFRLWPTNPIAVEQLQVLVEPWPTPSRPAEAPTFLGSQHVAPNLLLHPVLDEAEACTGVTDREVVDPAAEHRGDQTEHPFHRLRLVATEHILELPQQCRALLELRRVVGTPDAPSATDAAEVEAEETEALAAAKVHDSTLLFIDLDL